MISDILEIKSVDCAKDQDFLFECTGCIDVRADPVLEVLREVPPNSRVLLNFKQVERVNSMGLSLLLKIFQEWKKSGTRVEVYNLNKMVGILFKITGLGSYVNRGELADNVKTAVEPPRPQVTADAEKSANPVPSPQIPRDANVAPRPIAANPGSAPAIRAGTTLRFAATIANSFHRGGWFTFTTFMQRRLKTAIRFEQSMSIAQMADKPIDLLYANPYFACNLIETRQMIPVMRSGESSEQVVVLANAASRRTLAELNGAHVTAASPESLVLLLGRKLCDDNGLNSSGLSYNYCGNEIKTIQNLVKNRTDLAFISRQTYESLSSFSRNSVSMVMASKVPFSQSLFCIAPHLEAMKEALQEMLSSMPDDEEGRKILHSVKIDAWRPSEESMIAQLKELFHLYQSR